MVREVRPFGLQPPQRREFVRSFVEQAWARPGTDRPVSRVQVALMVTMGVLVLAMLTGVVLQLLRPVPLDKPAVTEPVSAAPTYAAVSGWDCETGPDRGFDVAGRTAAWYTVATGGYAEDGCHGTFEAIPLSGDADRYDQIPIGRVVVLPGRADTPVRARGLPAGRPAPGRLGARRPPGSPSSVDEAAARWPLSWSTRRPLGAAGGCSVPIRSLPAESRSVWSTRACRPTRPTGSRSLRSGPCAPGRREGGVQ